MSNKGIYLGRDATRLELQNKISIALLAASIASFTVLFKCNGITHQVSKVRSDDYRYSTSSCSKLMAACAILDQVAVGNLALTDKTVDVVETYLDNANSQDQTLQHLLSFTGAFPSQNCRFELTNPSTAWVDCINDIPNPVNGSANTPVGSTFSYNTGHLDQAGLMAVTAGSFADWKACFDAWTAKTGLFTLATWNSNDETPGAGMNVTAAEYMALLDAIDNKTILTPALCDAFFTDQTAHLTGTKLHAFDWHGEDWHWGFGVWHEQRNPDFVAAETVTRFATLGVGGQYNYIDRAEDYKAVLSFTGDFIGGIAMLRSIEKLLKQWARSCHAV